MEPDGLLRRLKHRKLVQWTLAYLGGAAALFGTLEAVGDVFAWPAGVMRALFFLLLAGLLVTIIVAWYHGERGRQRVHASELALLAAAAVLGFGGAVYSLRADPAAPNASSAPAVVVRPFAEASGAPDRAYLAAGVAQEIGAVLARRYGARVLRGEPASHGADARVLEGRIERTASGVRIDARLHDGGRTVWREAITAPALVDAEARIAAEVAAQIGLLDEGRLRDVAAVDPEAHDRYLRGEYALKQRSPASVIEAIAEYRAASSLDPGLTAALAREAYAYALFLDWGWTYPGLPPEVLMERGYELSERALAQDSASPEAWLARAYLEQLRQPENLEGAAESFGRAVALDPTDPEAQHQLGQTLTALGRWAEAKAAYHAALAIEPERPLSLVPLAAIALREGDPAGARRWADSAVALAGDAPYPWASRAQLRLGLGDAAGARDDAQRAMEIDASYEVPAQSALAAALRALGEHAAADAAIERARRALIRPDRPTPTAAYYLTTALLRMDRRAEALAMIESVRPRSNWFWFYLQAPAFNVVRDDPRFRAVMADAAPRR